MDQHAIVCHLNVCAWLTSGPDQSSTPPTATHLPGGQGLHGYRIGPVPVPAAITLFLLFAGFVTSGCLGSAGALVLYWMYSYAVGKHPIGAQELDQMANKIASIVENKEGQGREEDWAAQPQAHNRMKS
ncbi:hypothetical protein FNV43_RR08988 [Rhamnella rubrinervis]|uniref:Oleosin n=1 Tax=Rhamnella rubrinervis TaxID=2594499 RepID=A0A8K0HAB6_9ROSA|nr:hypothetical protein FNV43_RR08988 [Rhamnella rubrinervis]